MRWSGCTSRSKGVSLRAGNEPGAEKTKNQRAATRPGPVALPPSRLPGPGRGAVSLSKGPRILGAGRSAQAPERGLRGRESDHGLYPGSRGSTTSCPSRAWRLSTLPARKERPSAEAQSVAGRGAMWRSLLSSKVSERFLEGSPRRPAETPPAAFGRPERGSKTCLSAPPRKGRCSPRSPPGSISPPITTSEFFFPLKSTACQSECWDKQQPKIMLGFINLIA